MSSYSNLDGVPTQTAGSSGVIASDWNTYVRDNFDALKFGHLVVADAAAKSALGVVAEGTMVYQADNQKLFVYNSGWVELADLDNTGALSDAAKAAGGDLTGSFPNPTIASGAVTSAKIADGTIVNADISAGAAIDKSKISGTAVTVADSGTVTSAMIADGTIVNGDVSASAGIVYSKLALSNGIVNADVNSAAAIAYSKLNLAGSIVNADIGASAAIDSSKLADAPTSANTANKIVKRDSSGNFSAGTITATLSGNATGLASSGSTFSYQSISGQWYTGGNIRAAGNVYGVDGNFTNVYGSLGEVTTLQVDGNSVFSGTAEFDSTMYAPNMAGTTLAANVRRQTSSPYALVYNSSSRRFKTNIEQYVIDPDKLLGFRGVTYTSLCEGDDPNLLNVGFIAEEAEEAGLSEFVDYAGDGLPQNFNYAHFTAALLELCKYQEQRINDLEARISALEAK